MRLEEAIKQPRFNNEFEKADVNILYTANWMHGRFHYILKPYGISLQQFNILRILRGQNGNPAPLKLITERMLDKMSNTSRLVDKMLIKNLLERKICPENRRQVEILLTKKGLDVCNEISEVMEKSRRDAQPLSEKEAAELNRLLDKIRSKTQ
ncbi:MAG TPA: MarR family transcriptional regulator [Flavobacteriales bacterium]|nr:MarR family transcriptional regulator [Flavobacteriales bacterium]